MELSTRAGSYGGIHVGKRGQPGTAGLYWSVAVSTAEQSNSASRDDVTFRVTAEPIDAIRTISLVAAADRGAVATFVGLVRDHNAGRRVLYLEYECYGPLAVKAFRRIADEAREHWPAAHLAIEHRIGTLRIGEASVVIAVASAHRADAFAACRYAIERIKQIAPIWKREHFDGGDVWIEGATADPENDEARRQALARACA